ncbi:MAG: PA14 domain-containing protein [Chitinophagaceae bacterium]
MHLAARQAYYASESFSGYSRSSSEYYSSPVLSAADKNPFPRVAIVAYPGGLTGMPVVAENTMDDIGGPSQPEMSSFRSVGTDDMVNLFTGDFSYSIPLLDVAGYPVNLFYNAGASMDQEASWVGLGWNINPGTISRNMRGLPDDYNEVDTVTKVQSMKHDLTVGVTGSVGFEVAGLPFLSGNASVGIFYNNRRGLGLETGISGELSIQKMLTKKTTDEKTQKDTIGSTGLSASAGINLNSQNGMTLNGGFSVYKFNSETALKYGLGTSIGYSSRQGLTDLKIDGEIKSYKKISSNLPFEPRLAIHSANLNFARSSFTPSIRMPLTRFNQLYSVKFGGEATVWFTDVTLSGYVNETRIDNSDTMQRKPAYGYMYYEKGNNNNNALLDFNRLNDKVYTYKTPVLSLPVYTYDVFTINGEGTGGSFRGYRGNMGYVRDNDTKTKSGSFNLSFEIGPGNILHSGVVVGGIYSPAMVQEWKSNNLLRQTARFNKTDSIYQGFYFKNPGEKAIIDEGYYRQMGDDALIRPYLLNTRTPMPFLASGFQVFDKDRNVEKVIPVRDTTYRRIRDKKTQVITWLTAEEADLVDHDKYIYSYNENVFKPGSCADPLRLFKVPISRYNRTDPTFYRQAHHISKLNVLESDGRRYEYGIPVYQIRQKEVSFSTEATAADQLVSYTPGLDNTTGNKKGRDGFYQSELLQGYAHSYLLTSILSPDYVDVTGDGITDDDLGTSVKFNYSRVDRIAVGRGSGWQPFKWRVPADAGKANYNEGLKSDSRDDKGLYTYGEKELWYLHSIESKNMVATFRISERRDGRQVAGENGGLSSGPGQRKLDRIDLYTKADYLKPGARPIKTVHFKYSYTLCKHFNLNGSNITDSTGKLTLDSLWFTYNGNERQKKNKYVFKYSQTRNTVNTNPDYNSAESDRWGNYKAHTYNPDGVANNDYPYTLQDSLYSNGYASAWNLEKILLPSGAVIQVQYGADDYAYVQDKRASQMTKIAGFGADPTSTPSNKLYSGSGDNRFVFFDLNDPVANNAELGVRYMQDFKQLLLKLWVLMPGGNLGVAPAYEPVVVYGTIKSYSLVPAGGGTFDHDRFYVELEETKKGGSPIMETVIQFLKDYLPHRAYPGNEVNGDGVSLQLIRAIWGLVRSFSEGVLGFERLLKAEGKCKTVDPDMAFARLNNPGFKKIGGGHRVRRIIIADNWSKMTKRGDASGLPDSYYGQEYDYTTIEEVNGQKIPVSSGVASYEPGVGNEENPFREVVKYDEKQFLGPTQHNNIELPAAETFFPSPMVGYSKVTVRSIHNKSTKRIKSGVGLQQTEFYTTRDFPVITDFTSFDPQSRHHHKPSFLNKLFNFNQKDYMTLTQGFRIILNDMNGKMKFQASYPETDSLGAINSTEYYYRVKPYGEKKYRLDNRLPVIGGPDGVITTRLIGKEVELMNDFREHFTYTYSANIPLNGEFFAIGPFPVLIPTIFRMAFRDESMFRSATTLKIVNEYGILDSVVNIDKGSRVSTKNLVYDAESGGVLVSRTNNEFDKPVYQFNYPAWWVYTGMEPAYRNVDLVYKNVLFRNGKIEESPHVNMNYFESGDELFVMDMEDKGPAESPGCIASGYPAVLPTSNEYKIWAVDLRKDIRNETREFIFLDRYGNPYNSANATIRIIRSGKRNLTGASVGSVVSLASPLRMRGGVQRVIIDDTTDVVNSGAMEFKEKWRANDQFYAVDSTYVTVKQVPVHTATIYPVQAYSGEWVRDFDNATSRRYLKMTNRVFEVSKKRRWENWSGKRRVNYDQSSWIKFDLTGYEGAVVVNALLHMPPHWGNHPVPPWPFGIHGFNQAHSDANTKRDPNAGRLKLSRMVKPWYDSTNTAGWQSIFDNSQQEDQTNDFVTHMPTTFTPMSTERVNITTIASNMIKNMGDPTMATGIKLSYWNNSWSIGWEEEKKDDRTWRYCFNYRDGDPKNNYVYMNLSYYNCEEGDTILTRAKVATAPTAVPAGYAYCNTYETDKFCFSVFSKKQANPYVTGVLGNYRPFRSYVYYGERRESDPAAATDIRKDGIIKAFEPYWAFGTPQLSQTGSSKWVWNSEITQYNRKGAELENHDPLNRYNAGIYGYQESLPVAVVNNSRLRLSAFDGFEDYSYKDEPCEPYCKPSKRHFNAGVTPAMLVDSQAHTGRYSLKINANSSHGIDVKVSPNDSIAEPDIRIKVNKTPYEDVLLVTPKGTGMLRGYYYNNTAFSGTPTILDNDETTLVFSENRCHRDVYSPPYPLDCEDISVKWKGSVQVVTDGLYEFDVPDVNDEAEVYVNGDLVASNNLNRYRTRTPVHLEPGTLHTIEIRFIQNSKGAGVYLVWKQPGSNVFTAIPPQHLYPEGQESLAEGGAVTQTVYCEKPDTIQAIKHHLIDSFELVPGKRMVASVWMKKGGADCHCTSYTNRFVVRNAAGDSIATFQPKERVIEGWQQFEALFTVPESDNKIQLDLRAPADNTVYVDDLRLHPFNANMKSFVYDPVTLRLAAELDENNYASFYEYDDEGTLVRVKKETRLGIKTITETRSSLQKKITEIE